MSSKKQPPFRSGFERLVYDTALRNKKRVEYEPSDPVVNYTISARYIPDFILPNNILVECKGYFGPRDRAKMLRVKRSNPGLDIRFVFQRANNRLTKSPNSQMYWQWAEKHGFQWAEGSIPLAWWKEKQSG